MRLSELQYDFYLSDGVFVRAKESVCICVCTVHILPNTCVLACVSVGVSVCVRAHVHLQRALAGG